MEINELILEVFDPKKHFSNRFAKYAGTKTGRIRGSATSKAAYNAYQLGKRHGLKEASKSFEQPKDKEETKPAPAHENIKPVNFSKYTTEKPSDILKDETPSTD